MLLNDKQRNFVELCYKEFGDIKEITRAQLVKVEKKHKVAFPQWLVANKEPKNTKKVFSKCHLVQIQMFLNRLLWKR